MKLNIALVQIEITEGDKIRNLENALNILKELAEKPDIPDIVCFPELFTTGYDLENSKQHAEIIPGNTMSEIVKISQNKFIVIGSILEVENDKFYNTAFIIGKDGILIGKYRKTHLFAPMSEPEFLTPGDQIKTFILPEFDNLKVGLAICYDLRFPEMFRVMALEGAQIIFLPSEFPSPKKEIWKTLIFARAIENQFFVIGINRVGIGKSDEFFGRSVITNGDYFINLSDTKEIRVFTIDLDTLETIRKTLPLLKDRRPDLYRLE
jgi:predicted amidohydrolase